ncbi:MAG: ferrochelatase, partial [Anaerolineales bacterium]
MRDPIGVLLINVGTPEAPTAAALRRYLAQFLGDRRIIDYPRWLWLPILHGIILNVRPRRSARLYQNIWTKQGSPLLVIMRQQAEALRHQLLATTDRDVIVEIGLCYGAPSVAEGLHRLHQKGADQILLFPLYPQYSATTTAAGLDAAMAELTSWVELPEIHWTQAYHQHPGYLDALS